MNRLVCFATLLVVLALCVAGAHLQGQDQAPPETRAAEKTKVTVAAAERIGKTIEQYVANDYAVGAELLILQDGKPLFHQSYGLANRKKDRAWENNMLCNIRSMTKPITSAAAQILIDRELLELDVPVAKYLESFDNDKSRAITVRQVLTHRSGLPLTSVFSPFQYKSLSEQVAACAKQGPIYKPGSRFWYSDAGTDVVAELVSKISGKPVDEFVRSEILEPLGMTQTMYGFDAESDRLKKAAVLYLGRPKNWTPFWKNTRPLYPFAWGSQTIYSTTSDYAKFLQMLVDEGRVGERQILSKAAVDRMLAPTSMTLMMGSDVPMPCGFRDLKGYYGQMMISYRSNKNPANKPEAIGHSGSDGTIGWAWPERGLIILYFTQSRGGLTPLRIEDEIDKFIIHPGKPNPVPEKLRPYVGTYIANYGRYSSSEFHVTTKNGKLVLDVPDQLRFQLAPPDSENRWVFEMAPKEIHVKFTKGENESIVGLTLHKGDRIHEIPRKGTLRAKELTAAKRERIKKQNESKSKGKLKAAWVGKLKIGGMEPVMQFRIIELEDGKTKAFFDSITEGATDFSATWSIEKNQLNFDVEKIGLKFRGKLNDTKDSAEGTWSQGGRDLPLILKKQSAEFKEK